MTPEFRRAVSIILEVEGGDRVISDSGGVTKWGISARAHPDLDIQSLTRDQAERIYHDGYWVAVRADDMAWPLCLYVFDAAVNQGVRASAKMLQDAAGGLAIDGILGPRSMARISSQPPRELSARFMAKRALRYTGTRHFNKYGYGWMARLFRVAAAA